MKYAIEMGSGAMIYLTGFIKISSDIQKVGGGGREDSQRQHDYLKSQLLTFLKIWKIG
jgi:hypothetical protein